MKTRKLILLVAAGICFSFSTKAGNTNKTAKPVESKNLSLNFQHFENYLRNGQPTDVEGFYSTADKKYIVAIIKNDVKEHDYIGVMVKAKNSRYAEGELRFNFVQKNDSTLSGYYYDEQGNAQSVLLQIKTSNPKEDCLLSKIAYSEIPNENFVQETILDQLLRNQDC